MYIQLAVLHHGYLCGWVNLTKNGVLQCDGQPRMKNETECSIYTVLSLQRAKEEEEEASVFG